MGHSSEFSQLEGAGGLAVLMANFFYESTV